MIDLQINGCFGVDFNADTLTLEQCVAACQALQQAGVAECLATVMTGPLPAMASRLRRLASFHGEDRAVSMMWRGIHIEGPFINPTIGFVGAHPAEHVRPASLPEMQRLVDAGAGLVRLVTLAPEQDAGAEVTRWLVGQGIRVAAGHTDASRDQLKRALEVGLRLFTHLGNGCPRQLDRHDNIVQRAISFADHLFYTLIADGVHLPWFVIENFRRAIGADRLIVISDAMAAAGETPGDFRLGQQTIHVSAEGVARTADAPDYLAGSTVLLPEAARRLHTQLGWRDTLIRQVTSENAARCLRD